jgi:hypothetical protein
VFEGICWQKSFIPHAILEAGDNNSNLIETVHSDVNREGVHCTLIGGIKRAQLFDSMKMKALNVGRQSCCSLHSLLPQVFESFGITPSYKTGLISENALGNLKRCGTVFFRWLAAFLSNNTCDRQQNAEAIGGGRCQDPHMESQASVRN